MKSIWLTRDADSATVFTWEVEPCDKNGVWHTDEDRPADAYAVTLREEVERLEREYGAGLPEPGERVRIDFVVAERAKGAK